MSDYGVVKTGWVKERERALDSIGVLDQVQQLLQEAALLAAQRDEARAVAVGLFVHAGPDLKAHYGALYDWLKEKPSE